MRVPFGEQAVVPEAKIVDHLLNATHPVGRGKAAFFARLGFRRDQPDVLRRELRQLALAADTGEVTFAFGRKYVGAGWVTGPTSARARIVTVWVLREGLPPPILVTAYPAGGRG
jgi:uncharacterized protein DUF6883